MHRVGWEYGMLAGNTGNKASALLCLLARAPKRVLRLDTEDKPAQYLRPAFGRILPFGDVTSLATSA